MESEWEKKRNTENHFFWLISIWQRLGKVKKSETKWKTRKTSPVIHYIWCLPHFFFIVFILHDFFPVFADEYCQCMLKLSVIYLPYEKCKCGGLEFAKKSFFFLKKKNERLHVDTHAPNNIYLTILEQIKMICTTKIPFQMKTLSRKICSSYSNGKAKNRFYNFWRNMSFLWYLVKTV